MAIHASIRGNIFIVQIDGDINAHKAFEFESLLNMGIDDGLINIIFDFSAMTHISSDGLHVILKIIRILVPKHGIVLVVGMSKSVRSVFQASGFLSLLEEFEAIEEAVAAINDNID